MRRFSNILLAAAIALPAIAPAQDVVSIPAPSGIWVNYRQNFDAGDTYTISRKSGNGTWEEVAVIPPVTSLEDFKARIYNTTRQSDADNMPTDSMMRNLWNRYRTYHVIDSMGTFSIYLPVLHAAGAAWFDANAEKNTPYQYQVKAGKGKTFTSTAVQYPAAKKSMATIRPAKIQPVMDGVYMEFEIADKGTMQTCHAYRSYYMRSGFERIYPDVLFNTVNGKTYAVFTDNTAVPNVPYAYMLVPVDAAGNEGEGTDWLKLFNVPANSIQPSVRHIRATSDEAKKAIRISWDKLKEPTVISVEVYKSDARNGSYQRIASLKPTDTSFLDDNVMPVVTYFYTVALNGVFEQSVNSPRVPGTLRASYKNYLPPQHLSIELENGTPKLKWSRTEKDTRGYFIYRGEGYHGKMQKISNIILSNNNEVVWYDTAIKNKAGIYSYAVSDENTSYEEGPLTEPVSIQQMNSTGNPLPIATRVRVLPADKALRIVWDDLNAVDPRVSSYRLYRKVTDADDKEIEANKVVADNIPAETNFYMDANIKQGNSYIYAVEALDEKVAGSISMEAGHTVPVNYPLQVNDIQAYSNNGEVELQWVLPQGQQLKNIHILKAGFDKTPEVIASVEPGTETFIDKKVSKGTVYNYYFVTENTEGVSSKPTTAISITCK